MNRVELAARIFNLCHIGRIEIKVLSQGFDQAAELRGMQCDDDISVECRTDAAIDIGRVGAGQHVANAEAVELGE